MYLKLNNEPDTVDKEVLDWLPLDPFRKDAT